MTLAGKLGKLDLGDNKGEPMQLTRAQAIDAKNWLIECFPDEEDMLDQCCQEDIEKGIERHFDGGITAFLDTYRT